MKYVDQIKKIIRGLWAPFHSSNAKVIFLCLLGAFIFWLFNALNKEYTTRIDQSVDFLYDRDSLISVNELPKKISLNVTGGGWNLLRKSIGLDANSLVINLENPTGIRYLTQYNLLNIASDQLEEVDVNFVISDTIYLRIENKVVRKFAVDVDSSAIDMAKNYFIISDIRVNPDSILLEGPEPHIDALSDTILLSIPDMQIDDNFEEDVAVNLSIPGPIVSQPEKINVSFEVREYVNQTTQVKYARKNFPEDKMVRLSKSLADVTYKLPSERKGEMDTAAFSIVADFKDINMKDSTILLSIEESPSYLREVELLNPKVKVIIE